jgi:WD repeat and SOF domain-containing protein 1
MSSIHIPSSPGNRLREKSRSISISPRLPTVANGTHEKHLVRRTSAWTTTYFLPLPWPFSRRTGVRRLKILLPIPPKLYRFMTGLGRARPRGFYHVLSAIAVFAILWNLYIFARRLGAPLPPPPFGPRKPTLKFAPEDLRRIWEWEVASGHYQSSRKSECMY